MRGRKMNMKTWQVEAMRKIDLAAARLKADIAAKVSADWTDVSVEITAECSRVDAIESQYWNSVRSSTRYYKSA